MLKDFLNKEGKKSTKLCSLNLFKKKVFFKKTKQNFYWSDLHQWACSWKRIKKFRKSFQAPPICIHFSLRENKLKKKTFKNRIISFIYILHSSSDKKKLRAKITKWNSILQQGNIFKKIYFLQNKRLLRRNKRLEYL